MLHEGESQIGAASYQPEAKEIQISSSEQVKTPEVFVDPEATAAWFAGVLEVAATATIGISHEKQRDGSIKVRTKPLLDISCSPALIDRLQGIYGGQNRGAAWRKSGRAAAEIVASIQPFAVGRKQHSGAMQTWLTSGYTSEQLDIARSIQETRWQDTADASEYEHLLDNPAFLAGVIDNRGMVFRKTNGTLGLNIYSKNKALLLAMERKYGGKTVVNDEGGKEVRIGDVEFETVTDSEAWMLTCGRAREVIASAAPYVQEPLLPGWDESILDEQKKERDAFSSQVGDYVREEMRLLREEKIPRISTDHVLAAHFNVGVKKVRLALKRTLTAQEYQQRRDTIKRLSKISVDVVTNLAIRRYITQEVQDVLEGRKRNVTSLEDLAAMFGTSGSALQRQVIPHLDPEAYAQRLHFIRSEVMRVRNAEVARRVREGKGGPSTS